MEITGFQLEQQTTQRWGTTKPCLTADSHGGSVEKKQGFQVNMDTSVTLQQSGYTKIKFSVPKVFNPLFSKEVPEWKFFREVLPPRVSGILHQKTPTTHTSGNPVVLM